MMGGQPPYGEQQMPIMSETGQTGNETIGGDQGAMRENDFIPGVPRIFSPPLPFSQPPLLNPYGIGPLSQGQHGYFDESAD